MHILRKSLLLLLTNLFFKTMCTHFLNIDAKMTRVPLNHFSTATGFPPTAMQVSRFTVPARMDIPAEYPEIIGF